MEIPDEQTDGPLPAWERRATLGTASALVETTRAVLGHPRTFYRDMPPSGAGTALAYAMWMGGLGIVVALLYRLVFVAVLGESASGFLGGGTGRVPVLAQMLVSLSILPLGMLVTSAATHAALLVFGGAQRPFTATFRVFCYAEAASVLYIVPFCGDLGFLAGLFVLGTIGLSAVHRVTLAKAALATATPVLVLCCSCLGGSVLLGLLGGAVAR